MLILGCDISTATRQNPFGWALFEANHYLDSSEFTKNGNALQRILNIAGWVDWKMAHALTKLGSSIHYIVVERSTGDHGNRKTDRMLGGVYYLLAYLANKYGAEFADVTPAEVKASGVSKHNLSDGVAWIRNESGDPERKIGKDEIDAVGIVLAFLKRERIYTSDISYFAAGQWQEEPPEM